MEDLEPLLKGIGKAVGDNVADIAYLAGVMTDLADGADNVASNLGPLEYAWDSFVSNLGTGTIGLAADAIRELRGETNRLVGLIGGGDFDSAYQDSNFQIQAANKNYRDAAVRIDRINTELEEQAKNKDREIKSYGGGSAAVEKYTKKQQKLLDQYDKLGPAFQATTTDLIAQIGKVEEATQAVEAYADSIQQDLLSGINLGDIYSENFDEQGRQTGVSLLDGFNAAINQAEWFGNVLTAIKAQGADQSLIEQIAGLGPETGGALGQQLLNEGLVPTLNEKWSGVQDTTRELALGLVPEFLEAGRLSAIDTLNGLATQFKEDQKSYKKLGKNLGKQVGAEFKSRILKDVRDAVREVEAIATAARAEAVANAERQQARITEQAVASAISNLIRDSDQRAGRNVEPVLQ